MNIYDLDIEEGSHLKRNDVRGVVREIVNPHTVRVILKDHSIQEWNLNEEGIKYFYLGTPGIDAPYFDDYL